MKAQGFNLPDIFAQREDAVKFLNDNCLWLLHPGLAVNGMVEPKLKVRKDELVDFFFISSGVVVWALFSTLSAIHPPRSLDECNTYKVEALDVFVVDRGVDVFVVDTSLRFWLAVLPGRHL